MKEFLLPDFAETSPNQLRAIRHSELHAFPVFMGRGMTSPYYSPLQAVRVAFVLAQRKVNDSDYQWTPRPMAGSI